MRKVCGKEYLGRTILKETIPFENDGLHPSFPRYYITYNVIGDFIESFCVGPFPDFWGARNFEERLLKIDPFKYIDCEYLHIVNIKES